MKPITTLSLILFMSIFFINEMSSQENSSIRLNQLGYYPTAPKVFVVSDSLAKEFSIKTIDGKSVYQGKLTEPNIWKTSGESIQTGDFSLFKNPGKYYVELDNTLKSYPFEIKNGLYDDIAKAAFKTFYYQRASMPIEEKYAGKFKRNAGHPDTACIFHISLDNKQGLLSSPGGWYDAGDYNKYVVNAAITLTYFLQLNELFPNVLTDGTLNIPESGNKISDLLDEVKYELDWLLTMQDTDGGVFFKITHLGFDGFILPEKSVDKRYVVGKSTSSSLSYAGIMAQASRVFRNVNNDYSNRLLVSAEKAWKWSVANPDIIFKNPSDVHTGSYSEDDFRSKFFWAACELYTTSKKDEYKLPISKYIQPITFTNGGNWMHFFPNMGYFTLISPDCPIVQVEKENYKKQLYKVADSLVDKMETIPYGIPIDTFVWASNATILDAVVMLEMAYQFSKNEKYLNSAIMATDYILGRNSTGYSFITGFGSRSPMYPHHRLSGGDSIPEPIPGFLVGGPNATQNDKWNGKWGVNYAYKDQARSYMDVQDSWASNEIAINWNAPLVFVLYYFENVMGK